MVFGWFWKVHWDLNISEIKWKEWHLARFPLPIQGVPFNLRISDMTLKRDRCYNRERERERERTTSRTFKKSPKRMCCNIMVVVLDLKRAAHRKLNAWKKLGFTGFPFEQVGFIWNVEDFRVPGEALRRPAWISSRRRTRMMMPPHQSKLQMGTAKVRCFVW